MDAFMVRNRTSGLYLLKNNCRLNENYQWAHQTKASIFTNEDSMSCALRVVRPTELVDCEVEKFKVIPVRRDDDQTPTMPG